VTHKFNYFPFVNFKDLDLSVYVEEASEIII